jgi:hypothetical protein
LWKKFALKCIPGLFAIGVLPLGQGGQPPDVWVGLEIYQNATYIISSKFCKNNFALKCIPGPLPIGVLPLGEGGCPQMSGWVWKFFRILFGSMPTGFVKRILL